MLATLLLCSVALAGGMKDRLEAAPAVVWAGIDYSAARLFVPETFDDPEVQTFYSPGGGLGDMLKRYDDPQDAWNDLVRDWNTMLQNDSVEKLEWAIQRDLVVDLPAPEGQTKKSAPYFESQYEAKNNPPSLDQTAIAAMVKKYRLKTKDGMGLVFIYERADAIEKEACLWPTWFDVKKKEVVQTERVCEKPGGGGFRNYWYKPVSTTTKDIVKALEKDEL